MSNSVAIRGTFGFYPPNAHPILDKKQSIVHNVLNVCDAIPIIGRVSGVVRLVFAAMLIVERAQKGEKFKNSEKLWLGFEMARGILSGLGLGFLFAVPDMLFTMQGHFDNRGSFHNLDKTLGQVFN